MNRKPFLITALVVAFVLVAGVALAMSNDDTQTNTTPQTTDTTTEETTTDNTTTPPASTEDTSSEAATSSVTIQNYAYSPASITVKKGTKVTWTNQDSMQHDISSDDDSFTSSELLSKGESYSFTFDKVGTYTYHCSPHPYMKGSVTVTE